VQISPVQRGASRALECGSLLPLSEPTGETEKHSGSFPRARHVVSKSGGKPPPHSKEALVRR
jgi:hypothetical protein